VQFTTPLLAGARMREARNEGKELVVPNPSGGRGVYVLNWPGVRALGQTTLHDTVLFQRSSLLPAIEPASVRNAALEVAREGHAGRGAAAAAEATIARDRAQCVRAHYLLVTGLVEQVDPDTSAALVPAGRTTNLDLRARAALHRIAPSLGRPPADLAAALTALGDAFAPIGVATADHDARVPRLLIRLEETQAKLSAWLQADPNNDIGGLGEAIRAAMGRACESGARVLDRTRSMVSDPTALLRRWITDQSGVLAWTRRCDWLLDGWERVCLLWLSASTRSSQRAALLEMAPLVPVLPREVTEWTGISFPPETMLQACRVTSHQDSWRTGSAAFGLIERNEKLLAMGI
jgi:hypothetical protein